MTRDSSARDSASVQQQDISVMVHMAGADTGGAWSLVEITLARYAVGPPLHVHHRTREEVTVLEGLLVCTLGERTITVARDKCVPIPPGTVHTCFNPTASSTRLLLRRAPVPPAQSRADLAALTALAWQTIVRSPADQTRLAQAYDQQPASVVRVRWFIGNP